MKIESHLNSEQLDNLLGSSPNSGWQKHVDGCAACAQELGALRTVLGDFRQAATASAKHHRYLAPAQNRHRMPGPAWGMAFAALLISVGAPLAVHYGSQTRPDVRETPPTSTQQQNAISDEALLSGVQDDLSASVPRSMLPLSGASNNSNSETRKD